jgi:hypothetical protein
MEIDELISGIIVKEIVPEIGKTLFETLAKPAEILNPFSSQSFFFLILRC